MSVGEEPMLGAVEPEESGESSKKPWKQRGHLVENEGILHKTPQKRRKPEGQANEQRNSKS